MEDVPKERNKDSKEKKAELKKQKSKSQLDSQTKDTKKSRTESNAKEYKKSRPESMAKDAKRNPENSKAQQEKNPEQPQKVPEARPATHRKRPKVVMDDTGLLLGKVTNYIKVGSTIGHGAFGEVKRGTIKGTNVKVALKFIEKSQSEKHNIDLTVEGKLLRKLGSHPNILNYIGLYETDDTLQYVIATEYARGGDLLSLFTNLDFITVNSGYFHLSEQQLAIFFFQMVSAVYHCHRYNVIHRDIKTNNILCTKASMVPSVDNLASAPLKLADFGEAIICPANSKVRGGGGTYAFMSPERLNKRSYSYPADIWSLGVTLWELASGSVPWRGGTRADILAQMARLPVTRNTIPLKSKEGQDMMTKIFATDPNDRPTALDLLNHPWLTGEASVTSLNKEAVLKLRRHRIRIRFRSCVRVLIAGHRLARISAAKSCEPLFSSLTYYIKNGEDVKRLNDDMFLRTGGNVEISQENFVLSMNHVLNLHTDNIPQTLFRRFSQVTELTPAERRKSTGSAARRLSNSVLGKYDLELLRLHEQQVLERRNNEENETLQSLLGQKSKDGVTPHSNNKNNSSSDNNNTLNVETLTAVPSSLSENNLLATRSRLNSSPSLESCQEEEPATTKTTSTTTSTSATSSSSSPSSSSSSSSSSSVKTTSTKTATKTSSSSSSTTPVSSTTITASSPSSPSSLSSTTTALKSTKTSPSSTNSSSAVVPPKLETKSRSWVTADTKQPVEQTTSVLVSRPTSVNNSTADGGTCGAEIEPPSTDLLAKQLSRNFPKLGFFNHSLSTADADAKETKTSSTSAKMSTGNRSSDLNSGSKTDTTKPLSSSSTGDSATANVNLINIVSFCMSLITKLPGSYNEHLRLAFELVDRQKSGFIKMDEYIMIIQSMMFTTVCLDSTESNLSKNFEKYSDRKDDGEKVMSIEQFLFATKANENLLKYFDRVARLSEGTHDMFVSELESTRENKQGWLFWGKAHVIASIIARPTWKERFFSIRDSCLYGWSTYQEFADKKEPEIQVVLDSKCKLTFYNTERNQIKLKGKKAAWFLEAKNNDLLKLWFDLLKNYGCEIELKNQHMSLLAPN